MGGTGHAPPGPPSRGYQDAMTRTLLAFRRWAAVRLRAQATLAFAAAGLLFAQWSPASAQQNVTRQQYCFQLERQLADMFLGGRNRSEDISRIQQELQNADRAWRTAEARANRLNCYEQVLFFGRELRPTRECIRLDTEIRKAKDQLARLNAEQKRAREASRPNTSGRNDLIRALARNGCGQQYVEEARRLQPTFSFWGEPFNDDLEPPRAVFSTFRTMCVRMCDGFYFPVSFSTLSSRFSDDEALCQSQCAAPAKLFVHRNPGEEIEQMVSLDGVPYTALPHAFRFRQQVVNGCSCRPEEFSPDRIGQQQAGGQSAPPAMIGSGHVKPSMASAQFRDAPPAEQAGETGSTQKAAQNPPQNTGARDRAPEDGAEKDQP